MWTLLKMLAVIVDEVLFSEVLRSGQDYNKLHYIALSIIILVDGLFWI